MTRNTILATWLQTHSRIMAMRSDGIIDGFAATTHKRAIKERDAEPRRTITLQQASAMTGLCENTIRNLCNDGKLKFVKVPGVRRALIDYASFEALFNGESPDA